MTDAPLKKNDTVELEIGGYTSEGAGVGRAGGMAVFVPGSARGDRIKALIIKTQKSYAVGRILEIEEPSPYRIESDCPVSMRCGGCAFRHVAYSHELDIKRERVADAFARVGGLDVEVDDILRASPARYRNKAVYQFGVGKDGDVLAGFYAPYSHRIIPCGDCLLHPRVFADILGEVVGFIKEKNIPVYDETSGAGLMRRLFLRRGTASDEICVCFVAARADVPGLYELSERLTSRFPRIVSVFVDVDDRRGNAVMTGDIRLIRGRERIGDVLLGKSFLISPLSFYQVNHDGAELLFGKVKEHIDALGGVPSVLDMYCGAGVIGICCAGEGSALRGFDVNASSIDDARENARRNGLTDARFICADADEAARRLADEGFSPDVVIMDPPRKGSTPGVLSIAADTAKKAIVYVSCDPATLARDCRILDGLGWSVVSVTPVDMFPGTANVETVCCLYHQKRDFISVPYEQRNADYLKKNKSE